MFSKPYFIYLSLGEIKIYQPEDAEPAVIKAKFTGDETTSGY